MRRRAFAWILLYPDRASLAVVSIAGQQSILTGLELEQLLGLLDQVEGLTNRARGPSGAV